MDTNEARAYSDEIGCSTHGRPECLCDVQLLRPAVPIRTIPFPERLLELGLDRLSFVTWAEEISALHEWGTQALRLVAD